VSERTNWTVRRGPGHSPARQAYVAIRDAIVRVELVPGQRLSENELAERLAISRTPVREALARLRDEQLVGVVPQLGTFVSRISARAIADAQFIRESLECAAVRRTAERATDDDLASLEENVARQARASAAGDFERFYLLDDELHRALCDVSGHPTVWTVSQRVKPHLNRVRRLSLPMPDYLTEMVAEHGRVVAAVADHNPDEAELALRYHLRMVLREVPRIREQHPDFFEEA
jgi:GntR family transcriptional regulator, rspAB operon transcriptional repressor